ncbi:MAG: hypothetical protein R2702_08625 [Acidimicrobiales bacterium]
MAGTPRFEDITPGSASRRAPLEAAHRSVLIKLWLFVALAAFGLVITVITYVVADGGAIVLWWGPVVIGVIGALRTLPQLSDARRALDNVR